MRKLLLFFFLHSTAVLAQEIQFNIITPQIDASFRGLSVIDDSIAWISGTNGYIGKSINGGQTWIFKQIKGFEKSDFRSLYAFNESTAIIGNAGSPAYILYTNDGGENWKTVYKNEDSAAFFDGIAFWNNKDGIIYGDPINGKMLLLNTKDGGKNWEDLSRSSPILAEGEASFAASGTAIRCIDTSTVIIATGGKVSRLWISHDKGLHWNSLSTPILQGEKSTGIFSMAFYDANTAVIVGGDYKRDTLAKTHVFYTLDGGKNWLPPIAPTGGYRECVEYLSKTKVITTGPQGTDISEDGGVHWKSISKGTSFHVIQKARKGKLLLMAGGKGKINVIKQ